MLSFSSCWINLLTFNSLRQNLIKQSFYNSITFTSIMESATTKGFKFIDIGANLNDEMYLGEYNGSKKHEPDLEIVLERAWSVGLQKIIVTAGNLQDSLNAYKLTTSHEKLFSTVGVHPTRCIEFDKKFESPADYITALKNAFEMNSKKIVALGEFGLDYERTQFCDIDTQRKYFQMQLEELGPHMNLPLFLHCRGESAAADLQTILSENKNCFPRGGVVHSFDGTIEEMNAFLELGLHIGINGCSLKTEENCKVVKEIPNERLLLETDAPWCGMRPSHFGSKFIKTKFQAAKKNYDSSIMYKSRNEPHTILNVLEVVSGIKGIEESTLAQQVYENTENLFFSENCKYP